MVHIYIHVLSFVFILFFTFLIKSSNSFLLPSKVRCLTDQEIQKISKVRDEKSIPKKKKKKREKKKREIVVVP